MRVNPALLSRLARGCLGVRDTCALSWVKTSNRRMRLGFGVGYGAAAALTLGRTSAFHVANAFEGVVKADRVGAGVGTALGLGAGTGGWGWGGRIGKTLAVGGGTCVGEKGTWQPLGRAGWRSVSSGVGSPGGRSGVSRMGVSAMALSSDSDSGESPVPIVVPRNSDLSGSSDIFCNRELNMKQIKAIGFDMDYTLARYYTDFDQLAFDGAKEKLVNNLGYPREVLKFSYDPTIFARGLVIDLQLGNIIKMDRHKYVRVVFHGFRKISSEERKRLYLDQEKLQTFTGPKYVSMDTLFSLVDAVLYSHLIEFKDNHPDILGHKTYEHLFREVRQCVDLCHRDGVIKDRVAEDPAKYIMPDPELQPMLRRLKAEGVKVFLLTNSLWDYTNVVMNFLCGKASLEERTTEWLDLFDLAIVGSCKPGFLVEPFLSLFRVDMGSGLLRNTDGIMGNPEEFLKEGKVFQGGNWLHLHDLLSLKSGDQLLYVGDHMFADILRSKRTLGWRTCLIVPELEGEMQAHRENKELRREVNSLRTQQYLLDEGLDIVRLRVMEGGPGAAAAREELSRLEYEEVRLKNLLREGNLHFHSQFHPDWGQLFKAGYQESRFAKQVANYACLYTSKASNLGQVSTQRSFRPVRDVSPHDLLLDVDSED